MDLLPFGILPVLVVIENKTNQRILIQKENFLLFTADDSTLLPVISGSDAYLKLNKEIKEREKLAKTTAIIGGYTMILFFPAAGAIVAFGGREPLRQILSGEVNIARKLLLEKTLQYGGLHHGFIYFYLGNKETLIKNISNLKALKVDVKTLRAENTLTFAFDMKNIFDKENIRERIENAEEIWSEQDRIKNGE
ncbi:MAG: hypothetical protein HZA10_00215 [Nitrospirae bacterium]|nr:hypothetical protein [Nitrospirota bacterium]